VRIASIFRTLSVFDNDFGGSLYPLLAFDHFYIDCGWRRRNKTKKKDDGVEEVYEESENVLSFHGRMLYEAKVGGAYRTNVGCYAGYLILMHDGRY